MFTGVLSEEERRANAAERQSGKPITHFEPSAAQRAKTAPAGTPPLDVNKPRGFQLAPGFAERGYHR